ncbi:hypothetical protein IAT38_000654 [Cryptococcus sp. DSM 104549]
MAPPLVTIYVTSLTSAPTVRKHHDLLRRSLMALDIKHEEYDLVMDEEAKRRWQRAKPPGKVIGLPGYLVGGEWIGTMDDFEEAVETQSLETFLKQDIDLSHPSPSAAPSSSAPTSSTPGAAGDSAPKQKTIQEVELEKLMGEMTSEDLDKLMEELGVEDGGTVGLVPSPPPPSKGPEAEEAGGVKSPVPVSHAKKEEGDATPEHTVVAKTSPEPVIPVPAMGEDIFSKLIDEKVAQNRDEDTPDVKKDEAELLKGLSDETKAEEREEKEIAGALAQEEKSVGKVGKDGEGELEDWKADSAATVAALRKENALEDKEDKEIEEVERKERE